MKGVLVGALAGITALLLMAQGGNIHYDQIRSADRKGSGVQFQMFGGGAAAAGDLAVYDSGGNVIDGGAPPTANQAIRSLGAAFDGGGMALTSGSTAVTYFTVPFACTIAAFNITVDTGTISFDIWKKATGTAIPTVANTIMTGGYLAIASGTALHSTTLTDFTTTAVSANDIFGIEIEAVSSATKASLVIQCTAT